MLEQLISLDKYLFQLVNSEWTSTWADFLFPFITDLHKNVYFKAVLLPVFLLLLLRQRGFARGTLIFIISFFCLGISDGTATWIFKKNVQRPRPPNTQGLTVNVRAPFGGYSFVSNHAANTFSLATFIGLALPQTRIVIFSIALLVGYSRVYCGVHFPLDVICGALLGITIGLLMMHIYRFILLKLKLQESRQ
jgi:undecaprenyl-diphosphatase